MTHWTIAGARAGTAMMAVASDGPAENPDPAPGQVWLPPDSACPSGWMPPDGLFEVASADSGTVRFGGEARGCGIAADAMRDPANGWTCIGVATPHGRVMVGDGFRSSTGACRAYDVTAVNGTLSDSVVLSGDAGTACATLIAATWTRTRYAPARAGGRYASRLTPGRVAEIDTRIDDGTLCAFLRDGSARHGLIEALPADGRMDPAQWERLDPGAALPTHERSAEHRRLDAYYQAQEDAEDALRFECRTCGKPIEYEGACSKKCADGGAPPYTYGRRPGSTTTAYEHAADTMRARDLTLFVGADVGAVGAGAGDALALQATAADLRALHDALGRALELTGAAVYLLGAGRSFAIARDEMLFTPTVRPAPDNGTDIAADTKALCALRATVGEAMATGGATLPQWGAKGPRVEVRREGGPAVVATAPEASEAPRYVPDSGGGAQAWRWEV